MFKRFFLGAVATFVATAVYAGSLTLLGVGTPPSSFTNTRSLIYTAASTQSLSRVWGAAAATSQRALTLSCFYKRNSTGSSQVIFAGGESSSNNDVQISFTSGNTIQIFGLTGGSITLQKSSTATFTDTTNWHHVVVAFDSNNATASLRVRVYHDAAEITSWGTNTIWAQNTDNPINKYNATNYFGRVNYAATNYFDGKLDECAFVDGQTLSYTSFANAGAPINLAGLSFGVKGFWTRHENNASTTTLGVDSSGNGNGWTLNSMTTSNSSTDHP